MVTFMISTLASSSAPALSDVSVALMKIDSKPTGIVDVVKPVKVTELEMVRKRRNVREFSV